MTMSNRRCFDELDILPMDFFIPASPSKNRSMIFTKKFEKELVLDGINHSSLLYRLNDKFIAMKKIADKYFFNRKTFISLKDIAKLDRCVFNILSFKFNNIIEDEDNGIEELLNNIFIKDLFEIITTFKKVTLNLRRK